MRLRTISHSMTALEYHKYQQHWNHQEPEQHKRGQRAAFPSFTVLWSWRKQKSNTGLQTLDTDVASLPDGRQSTDSEYRTISVSFLSKCWLIMQKTLLKHWTKEIIWKKQTPHHCCYNNQESSKYCDWEIYPSRNAMKVQLLVEEHL